MRNFFIYLFLFIVGGFIFIFLLSYFYHLGVFKYLFQALTSFSLIIAGIYYLLKGNIKLSISLFILSVLMYYFSELLFLESLPEFKDKFDYSLNNNLVYHLWLYFLNIPLSISHSIIRTWHMLLGAMLFANAMVLARADKNKIEKLVAANFIAILFTMVVYFMFR
ncbi:MAG: hypothetical protein ACOCWW_00470 [Bacteroidota bacterium]